MIMAPNSNNPNEEQPRHQWQIVKEGWYDKLLGKVDLSVRTLDIIIVVCVVALVVSLGIGIMDRGYTVQFNTLGGTTVQSQKLMYGDLVTVDEPPTREGYVFAGWYRDILCDEPWDLETDTVEGSMTLYAAWEEKTE